MLRGHIELERENVSNFNNTHGAFAITFPFRSEKSASIMCQATKLVAQCMLIFLISSSLHKVSGNVIDLITH